MNIVTDKREQLIALCQLLNLSKTIKDDPAELIDAVLCENARINAELVKVKRAADELHTVLDDPNIFNTPEASSKFGQAIKKMFRDCGLSDNLPGESDQQCKSVSGGFMQRRFLERR